MAFIAPKLITQENTYCPGCGHSIVDRLLAEVVEEMGMEKSTICSIDIACSYMATRSLKIDNVVGPHGKMAAVASGLKRVRPEHLIYGRCGDGAAYAIGLAETMSAAIRNENVTMIVVNNNIYGMTGGQMAPTTLIGQKTASSPKGRVKEQHGMPLNIMEVLKGFEMGYLARGTLVDAKSIRQTKKYIRNAFEAQMNNEGFSFVEILSPCPTNWYMTPLKSLERIKNDVLPVFPLGEYIKRG